MVLRNTGGKVLDTDSGLRARCPPTAYRARNPVTARCALRSAAGCLVEKATTTPARFTLGLAVSVLLNLGCP